MWSSWIEMTTSQKWSGRECEFIVFPSGSHSASKIHRPQQRFSHQKPRTPLVPLPLNLPGYMASLNSMNRTPTSDLLLLTFSPQVSWQLVKSLFEHRSISSVKNSLKFVEKIKNVLLSQGSTLVSFDIKSLLVPPSSKYSIASWTSLNCWKISKFPALLFVF